MRLRKKSTRGASIGRRPHLSGDQKPSVFRYSSNRSQSERVADRGNIEPDPTEKSEKFRRRIRSVFLKLAALVIVAGLVYLSTLSTEPKIIIKSDSKIREISEYRQSAIKLLESRPQNRFKSAIDGPQVASQLQKSFPELKSVSLSTPLFGRRPIIEINVAEPAVLFSSGGEVYLVDDRGIALIDIIKNPPKFTTSTLPKLNDQTNYNSFLGKPALTSQQISYTYEIKLQSEAKQLVIESMSLLAGGGELDVKYKNIPYVIKFNFFENARKSMGTFLAAKEQLNKDGLTPSEYIDVRVVGRAYVK